MTPSPHGRAGPPIDRERPALAEAAVLVLFEEVGDERGTVAL